MMKQLKSQICISSFLMALLTSINCELTRGPSDVYGVTGSTVTLHCSTNLSVPVQWEFRRVGAVPKLEPWALVYFGYPVSQITARYRNKNKYNVTVDSTRNEYNLMIYNLQTADAGTYRCIDDYGLGGHKHDEGIPQHEYRAQVVTIDGNLTCFQSINDSRVNQSDFELEQDDKVKLGCNLTYVGSTNPRFLWSVFHMESGIEKLIYHPQPITTELMSGIYRIITSEIEITASMNLHIRCNLTGPVNLMAASNSDMLRADWIVNVSDTTQKLPQEPANQNQELEEYTSHLRDTVVASFLVISLILIGALIGVCMYIAYLLKKSGYRITPYNLIRFHRVVNIKSLAGNLLEPDLSVVAELLNTSDKVFEGRRKFVYGQTSQQVLKYRPNKSITGITVVDNLIFFVELQQPYLHQHDQLSLIAQPHINIPGMKSPHGLAGCSYNKTLYISDDELTRIYRISLIDKSIINWGIKYPKPHCISLTSEYNLLIAIHGTTGRALEYSNEGQLMREIKFHESITEAWKTIELSNNQFLITHGWNSTLHRLCVIDAEGQITKSYGSGRGSHKGQLNVPWSLTVDHKRGNYFVADSGNNRILMFDADLALLGQVQTRDDLSAPSCLYFDSNSDRLIVGEYNGRVLIISESKQ